MILVDTSVWVAHLWVGEPALATLLEAGQALVHPFVIGELALGHMRKRQTVLALLHDLPQPPATCFAAALMSQIRTIGEYFPEHHCERKCSKKLFGMTQTGQ